MRLSTMAIIGIILIILGVVGLLYGSITYVTREKEADIGPIEVHREKERTIPLPPILGGLALAAGIALLIASGRR